MKRANGTGSVVKLSGNRRRPYAVRVSSRDKYNQIVQHTLSYHATAKEAQLALDEYNRLRAAGQAPDPNKLEMTVQQIYDAWSARAYKKKSDSTIGVYTASWNKRISRYADRKMRSVTLDEWQSILDEDESLGLSQSSINSDVILIKGFHSYAVERDIIGKDYSQFLDIPSVGAKMQKGSFSDIQMTQLEQLAAHGEPWADTVLILCYT
ncbi:MAG: integrase, partial [Oscillospiraceae bacterium]|nr:integrase [Oscillospiraceae bacterium]